MSGSGMMESVSSGTNTAGCLSLGDLRTEVSHFLGYGRTYANLSATQQSEVDFTIQSGLRKFYYPPVDHQWSFMRPHAALTVSAKEAALPWHFGGFYGDCSWQDQCSGIVSVISEAEMARYYQFQGNTTGRPRLVSVRPTDQSDPDYGYTATFWPEPDDSYTLIYRYIAVARKLTDDYPYHLGGAPHTETVLESCLSVAESRRDDAIGVHASLFQERLAASVAADKPTMAHSLGFMYDPGMRPQAGDTNRTNGVVYLGRTV